MSIEPKKSVKEVKKVKLSEWVSVKDALGSQYRSDIREIRGLTKQRISSVFIEDSQSNDDAHDIDSLKIKGKTDKGVLLEFELCADGEDIFWILKTA